jgi:hypothetical protein
MTASPVASSAKIQTALTNLGIPNGFIAYDTVPLLQQLVIALGNVTGGGGGGGDSAPTNLAYAATITPNFADGPNRQVTMTGDLTLNGPTGGSNGSTWQVRLIASGAIRTITLGTDIVTPTGTTFSGAVASGSTRLLQMIYNGSKWWVVRNQEFTA